MNELGMCVKQKGRKNTEEGEKVNRYPGRGVIINLFLERNKNQGRTLAIRKI